MDKKEELLAKLKESKEEIEADDQALKETAKLLDESGAMLAKAEDQMKGINESFITLVKIDIEAVDITVGVLKNILSISFAGFVALLGIPTEKDVAILAVFCIFIAQLSLLLIVLFMVYRHKLKNDLKKRYDRTISLQLDTFEQANSRIMELNENSRKKMEEVRQKIEEDDKELQLIKKEVEEYMGTEA